MKETLTALATTLNNLNRQACCSEREGGRAISGAQPSHDRTLTSGAPALGAPRRVGLCLTLLLVLLCGLPRLGAALVSEHDLKTAKLSASLSQSLLLERLVPSSVALPKAERSPLSPLRSRPPQLAGHSRSLGRNWSAAPPHPLWQLTLWRVLYRHHSNYV